MFIINRISTLLFILITYNANAQKFSKAEVLEDLSYLKSSLEETHYNLYAYTPKAYFNQKYEEVKATIKKDSFHLLEATRIFQQVITRVDNGHTEIDFPGSLYRKYVYSGGTLFPIEVALQEGRALIRKNWSSNSTVPIGADLVSINGLPIREILHKIAPHISAERPYLKHSKIELYSLPRLHWYVFGSKELYTIEIIQDGQKKVYQLEAISALEDYETKRNEVLNAYMNLKICEQVAYLNPGHFAGDKTNYRHFIDSAFAEILKQEKEQLIIDLRNNGGGDDAFSDYLVSYIADIPFKWNSHFSVKTSALLKADTRQNRDTANAYWKRLLSHKDGAIYEHETKRYEPRPENQRFKGKVYVLVNRQSHSQSAVTAAQIQDYGFGVIVGEETGDYPSLYASQFQYTLPQTGVTVKVSKGRIIRVNGSTKEEGVIPDMVIQDHLLDEEDEILEALLKQIK